MHTAHIAHTISLFHRLAFPFACKSCQSLGHLDSESSSVTRVHSFLPISLLFLVTFPRLAVPLMCRGLISNRVAAANLSGQKPQRENSLPFSVPLHQTPLCLSFSLRCQSTSILMATFRKISFRTVLWPGRVCRMFLFPTDQKNNEWKRNTAVEYRTGKDRAVQSDTINDENLSVTTFNV